MALVSVTRLRVRSWKFIPAFFFHTALSAWQARNAAGILAVAVLKDDDHAYWTRTVWKDETAVKAFMVAGSHRRAMPKLLDFCDEAAVVRWHQENTTAPAWGETHQRLQQEGRRSKVNHPSAAHSTFQIPVPRICSFSEIILK